MREIKFRAWNRITKTMHPKYGVLSEIKFGEDNAPSFVGIYEYVQIDEEGNGDWDGFSLDKGEFDLMQFTGLKDKNGVEIFEGDIVDSNITYSTGEPVLYQVTWDAPAFVFRQRSGLKSAAILAEIFTEQMTVIDNIHKNPELLEKT